MADAKADTRTEADRKRDREREALAGEAKEAGVTVDELLAERAAQKHLWPLG